MKKINTLLGVFFLVAVNTTFAATYYVSSADGSDSYTTVQAQDIGTPWKTIQHAAENMTAGDTCLIQSGIYRETVVVPTSGSSTAPITFQAYNSGTVTISGSDPVSGWTLEGSNIYYAPMILTLGDNNQVFFNGNMVPEARWPNAGSTYPWQDSTIKPSPDWAYVDTAGMDAGNYNWMTDSELPSRPDGYWNGCTMQIISGYGWSMRCPTITGYTDSTKTLTTDQKYTPDYYRIRSGNEYYLIGKKQELDSHGEWWYDTVNSRLYIYSTSTPISVETKSRSYGFDLSGRSNIQLKNLNFFACTIKSDSSSSYNIYDGLNMKYLNHSRKWSDFYGLALQTGDVLRNSELAYDSRCLVSLMGSDIRVINNYLHDSGYVASLLALINKGAVDLSLLNRNLISHNTMHDSGRSVITTMGKFSIIEYNDFYNAMKLTSDGGILYANGDGGNAIYRYNLFHDSQGAVGHLGMPKSYGFYLDNLNNNWIIHHNILWNVSGRLIFFNPRQNFNMVFNNTCWDAPDGPALGRILDNDASGTCIFNNIFNMPLEPTMADVGYNLDSNPSFMDPDNLDFRLQSDSPAIDMGTIIPGVTDGYIGNAPDIGALEYGGTDWTTFCGHNFTNPPSPDPVYNFPDMIFCNKVKDGSFENGSIAPNWTISSGANVDLLFLQQQAWNDDRLRTDYYGLQFDAGNSTIKQTVTGLQPNKRYHLLCGFNIKNTASTVKLGVKNYGMNILEKTISSTVEPWQMASLSFVTGPSSTSAEIYISVSIPDDVTVPVYVDDVCVKLYTKKPNPDSIMPFRHFSLDETSGTVVKNRTTAGSDGTLHGTSSTAWGVGKLNNALVFNGSDNYVTASMGSDPWPSGSFTVTCWVNPSNQPNTSLVKQSSVWNDTGWRVIIAPTGANVYIALYLWDNSSPVNRVLVSLGTIPYNSWSHVTFSIDREKSIVNGYLNGVLTKSTSIPSDFGSVATTDELIIGQKTFAGKIDDVRLYDHALSSDKIAEEFSHDTVIEAYFTMDESAGALTALDSSIYNRNGLLYGPSSSAWVPGKMGNALECNGIDNYLSASMGVAWPSESFSVACWVNPSNQPNTSLVKQSSVWNDTGWRVIIAPTGANVYIALYLWDNSSPVNRVLVSLGTIPYNSWSHVTFSIDREKRIVNGYLNGILTRSTSIPSDFGSVATTEDLIIGQKTFAGKIDDVRLYGYALSEDKIAEILSPSTVQEIHFTMNESSGATTAWDSSVYSRNGTLHGSSSLAWVPGKMGNALACNGIDNYLTISMGVVPWPSGSFTVTCWVNPSNQPNTSLVKQSSTWNDTGWRVIIAPNGANVYVALYLWDNSSPVKRVLVTLGIIPYNSWSHVAFTIDRELMMVNGYLNGTLMRSTPIPSDFGSIATTDELIIGQKTFEGSIDDVRLYSKVLNWIEILEMGFPHNEFPY